MLIEIANDFKDYALLDSGNGRRLERFGKFLLSRPDPGALWTQRLSTEWQKVDAAFEMINAKEQWNIKTKVPEKWEMEWNEIKFFAKLSPFKHTGVFPEQSKQWEWIQSVLSSQVSGLSPDNRQQKTETRSPMPDTQPNILNLFGYTGIASLVCAEAGASVTHVDGSFPTIGWARENQKLSGLENKPIRWILDDALTFVRREIKRGVKYDGIIMDPPVYGHGPKGERWEFSEDFPRLLEACKQVLTDGPLFVLINAYAVSSSAIMLGNVLTDMTKDLRGTIEYGELALQEENNGRLLSTGIFGRWNR